MRTFTTHLFLFLIPVLSFDALQAQSLARRMADKKFKCQSYAEAIPLYEAVLEKDPTAREVRVKLAECYREIKDYKNALQLYAVLAHEEAPAPENIWNYAQALAQAEKYEDAVQWFAEYARLMPQDEKARRFSQAYKDINSFYSDSSTFTVDYLFAVNSWQADFSPVFYKQGLLFCSGRAEEMTIRKVYGYDHSSLLDWYFISDTAAMLTDLHSEMHKTKYTRDLKKHHNDDFSRYSSIDSDIPAHYNKTFLFDSIRYTSRPMATVKGIHHPFGNKHVGPVCFTADEETIVFTVNELDRHAGMNQLNLYSATIEGKEFTHVQRLPFNGSGYSVAHPCFTPDYKRLYFASNKPGGAGGTDIYFVEYDNSAWSNPVNVKEINTSGDEAFPYVDKEGNLYFASDGHPGLGGLDIFCATLDNGTVQDVKNMGYPMNSSKDDFGIIFSNSMLHGYFSSNRKRGFSDDDLYYFQKGCRHVELYVYDNTTRVPVSNVTVRAGDFTLQTDAAGRTQLCLESGESNFALTAKGYELQEIKSNAPYVEVSLQPLRFNVQGTVISDAGRKAMQNVTLQLINENDNTITEWVTGSNGLYDFPLNPESTYKLVAAKENCGTNTMELITRGLSTSRSFNADMIMLCKGDIVRIDNIYYDLNKATIRADAAAELDKLAELMYKYPDMRIELRSHTDSRAERAFNMKLSALRAQSVVDYLTGKGIVPYRMRAVGFGESQLLNGCADGVACSEEEHQQNRRTEFKVLSIKGETHGSKEVQEFIVNKSGIE